jgi:hypothetical protein
LGAHFKNTEINSLLHMKKGIISQGKISTSFLRDFG